MASQYGSDWFYHPPSKAKDGCEILKNTESLISQLTSQRSEPARKPLVKDTDSSYVKLAKLGGRKDLFKYIESTSLKKKEPVDYKKCEWFAHEENSKEQQTPEEVEMPPWYCYDDNPPLVSSYPLKTKRPILGYDGLQSWQRKNTPNLPRIIQLEKCKKKKKKEVPNLQLPVMFPRGGFKAEEKLVEMSHLLAHSYQEDFVQETTDLLKNIKLKKKDEKRMMKEKLKQDKFICRKKVLHVDPIPTFKLSKFGNVPAKIDSHRD